MNDHIPDLTKMVSDTPISDSTPHNVADLGMLCRRLERELNAANSINCQQQLLDEQNLRLQERIKRLEEALESIREYWNGDNNSRAMIDACWYAIDKASEALESKERIELLMSANADVARIAAERDAAERRVMHLEAALRKIADQDYRGNRSTESQIALMALEVKP